MCLLCLSNFVEDEIILSSKDFPNIKVGDVIEIYHPQDEGCRLLLQVLNLKDEMQTKGNVGKVCCCHWKLIGFNVAVFCFFCRYYQCGAVNRQHVPAANLLQCLC